MTSPTREAGTRRPPRICMIKHTVYPVGEPRVQRAAEAAVSRGYAVEVLCLKGPGEEPLETIGGIDVLRLPVAHERGAGVLRMLLEYLRFLSRVSVILTRCSFPQRRYDIVHLHAPPEFLIAACLVPRLLGTKVILDNHDPSPLLFAARFADRRARRRIVPVLTRLERWAYRQADHVLAVHEPLRREVLAAGISGDRVTAILNSPDETVLARARVAHSVREDTAPTDVVYHGTITRWYGVEGLVEALEALHRRGERVRALILGAGDELASVRSRVADAGLEEFIRFSGRYEPLEVTLGRIAGARCGVVPNPDGPLNRFMLSNKLMEYVALGIPVVATRLATVAAHFSEEEITFVEPGDPAGMADGIHWVLNHPEAAGQKTQRAAERLREYSWSTQREALLSVYAGLVPGPG